MKLRVFDPGSSTFRLITPLSCQVPYTVFVSTGECFGILDHRLRFHMIGREYPRKIRAQEKWCRELINLPHRIAPSLDTIHGTRPLVLGQDVEVKRYKIEGATRRHDQLSLHTHTYDELRYLGK